MSITRIQPSVDLSNVHADLVTAKGDLLVAYGDAELARLGIGANGYLPVADSTTTPGIAWKELGVLNAIHLGASRAIRLTDVAMTSGSGVLASAGAAFAATDVGKLATVIQADQTVTGDTDGTGSTIRNVSSAAGVLIQNGMKISGAGIPAGATIASGAGTATWTISAPNSSALLGTGATSSTITVSGAVAASGTITARGSATQITLSDTADADLTNATLVYGSDCATLAQTLIDAATKNVRYWPGGDYMLSTGLTVDRDNVTLVGDGQDTIFHFQPGVAKRNCIRVNTTSNNDGTVRLTNSRLSDFRIEAYGATHTTTAGGLPACVTVYQTDNAIVDNLYIKNPRVHGIFFEGCTNGRCTNNTIDTIVYSGAGNGISMGGTSSPSAGSDLICSWNIILGNSDVGIQVGSFATARMIANQNIVRGGQSGVISEGGTHSATSQKLVMVGNIATDCLNVGLGLTDATGGNTEKHRTAIVALNQAIGCKYGLRLVGSNYTAHGNQIIDYTALGIWIGGTDYDESDIEVVGGIVTAASTATGAAIALDKTGSYTNYLQHVTVRGVHCYGGGATGGTNGVALTGKLRDVTIDGVRARNFKNSGFLVDVNTAVYPVDFHFRSCDSRNNNQGANAAGKTSCGFAVAGGDRWSMIGCTGTDDQAVKTQTHGLWFAGSATLTRGRIVHNELTGNATAGTSFNGTADANTIYRDNREKDAAYEGVATANGTTAVVISTTAIRTGAGAASWGHSVELSRVSVGGTPGALYISAVSNGTSFSVKSTDAADTGDFRWRIH